MTAELVVHQIFHIVVGRDVARGTRTVQYVADMEADGELLDVLRHVEISHQVGIVVTGGETFEETIAP